jgi:hypothetical protein
VGSATLLYVGEAKEPVILSERDICMDGCSSEMVVRTPIAQFLHGTNCSSKISEFG